MQLKDILRSVRRRLFRRQEGETLLRSRFRRQFGRELDTLNPSTFSERVFARMIEVNRKGEPAFTRLADKYEARRFVSDRLGPEFLVSLIWSGTNPDEIPFDSLPLCCMIKTNHGSGSNIVFREGADIAAIKAQLREWLSKSFYWQSGEFHYHAIPPRILIEEFLQDGQVDGPLDYRFWCFHGQPKLVQVDNSRHDINPFYDKDWMLLDCRYRASARPIDIQKPKNLEKMLKAAARLSSNFDFVRVDLYDLGERVVFGEMTFTPVAGQVNFQPAVWDSILGQYWADRP